MIVINIHIIIDSALRSSMLNISGKWLREEEKRLATAVYELAGVKPGKYCSYYNQLAGVEIYK